MQPRIARETSAGMQMVKRFIGIVMMYLSTPSICFSEYSETRCRESPSAWRTKHKKHVHVSFILNNGKISPRRATALVALEMIDQKKESFQLYI